MARMSPIVYQKLRTISIKQFDYFLNEYHNQCRDEIMQQIDTALENTLNEQRGIGVKRKAEFIELFNKNLEAEKKRTK